MKNLKLKWNTIAVFSIVVIYLILWFVSINYCYFWDNISLTSKQAHWFYDLFFGSGQHLINNNLIDYDHTSFHTPLMGIMTAILWKVAGQSLWVSHTFVLIWALILIYQLQKLLSSMLNYQAATWAALIILLEPTLLSQFVIASPDFILITSFVICLRAIIEKKQLLLTVGLFFLMCINVRGLFAGIALALSHLLISYLNNNKKISVQLFIRTLFPYISISLLLATYYSFHIYQYGWFFKNDNPDGFYTLPQNTGKILKHIAEYGIRSIENGRILIWIVFIIFFIKRIKQKTYSGSATYKFIFMVFAGITAYYILFIFISQMPFSGRYFMPQFMLMSIMVVYKLHNTRFKRRIYRTTVLVLILLAELTGHFWIYPDRIAKSWDCTMAHISYYPLRQQCFEYIDKNKINYDDISAGYSLYGSRQFVELMNKPGKIGDTPDRKYFIYSNISNLDDQFAMELKDTTKWHVEKKFSSGFVKLYLMKKNSNYLRQ